MILNTQTTPLVSGGLNLATQTLISVLGMPDYEVANYLADIVESNPLIDIDHFENYYRINEKPISNGGYTQDHIPEKEDIRTLLLNQINDQNFNEQELLIANYIIYNIDDYGYLKLHQDPVTEICHKVIKKIKDLNPSGIGCENFKEYLIYQLEKLPKSEKKENALLIANNIPTEINNKNLYTNLKNHLSLSESDFISALTVIKQQKPFPLYGCNRDKIIYNIKPDVKITQKNDYWDIVIKNDFTNYIKTNDSYLELIKNNKEIKLWSNEVNNLLYILNTRKTNLMKISHFILENQIKFFNSGIKHLKPISVKNAAEIMEINESTLYRIINKKYIQCKFGIFEMKWFFSTQINEKEENKKTTVQYIEQLIKEMVDQEERASPLSDEGIKSKLEEKNISISRRTVTKYRQRLHIANSSERKYL